MTIHTLARQGDRLGLGMIMLSAVLWGTVGLFVQILYASSAANSWSIGFFRLAISVPVLSFACARTLGWQMFQIAHRDLIVMVFTGVMTAAYQVCYFAAIGCIGVAASTLITLCTVPIWVALLAALVLHERLSRQVLIAGGLAIAGTALLVNLQTPALVGRSPILLGICFALSSAVGYACVTLCGRSLAKRYHSLQSLTISVLTGAIFLFPVALTQGLVLHYSIAGWVSLVYLGVVATALAYVLYFHGMRYTSATVASIAILMEPLISTLLAWWLLGERLGGASAVGGVLLLIAIAILYRAKESR